MVLNHAVVTHKVYSWVQQLGHHASLIITSIGKEGSCGSWTMNYHMWVQAFGVRSIFPQRKMNFSLIDFDPSCCFL